MMISQIYDEPVNKRQYTTVYINIINFPTKRYFVFFSELNTQLRSKILHDNDQSDMNQRIGESNLYTL